MAVLGSLKRTLRAQRESENPLVRHGVDALYAIRGLAGAVRSFVSDDQYRSIQFLRWFHSASLHQTTVLTSMDRYPTVFSACRHLFAEQKEIRILSFGCSSGEEVLTLRQYFPHAYITGADINPRSLALCRKHLVD